MTLYVIPVGRRINEIISLLLSNPVLCEFSYLQYDYCYVCFNRLHFPDETEPVEYLSSTVH